MFKFFLLILFISLTMAFLEVPHDDDITVNVKIEGFKSEEGLCRLFLFAGEKGFPDSSENAAFMLSGSIRDKLSEFSFKIKPGIYAISVLHDKNSNEKMDKTWYGKPMEGFGSSNNPKASSGPPGFQESALNIDESNNYLNIRMNYL